MVTMALFLANLCNAFTNVVAGALMVVQQSREPKFGNADLVAIFYLSLGFGGIVGCIFGAYMTNFYHPKYCFFALSFLGLNEAYFGCQLTIHSETDYTLTQADLESDLSLRTLEYEYRIRN